MSNEDAQEVQLAGGEGHGLAALGEPVGARVEPKVAELRHLGIAASAGSAPHDGAHPGQQFARIEGLAHVVVGAHFEADDAVHLLALGGNDDDRRVALAL